MKKIICYVYDEIDGAVDDILSEPNERLAKWLWDQNIEVTNIKCEDCNNYEDDISDNRNSSLNNSYIGGYMVKKMIEAQERNMR